MTDRLMWASESWLGVALGLAAVAVVAVVISYWLRHIGLTTRWIAGSLKVAAILLAAICLLEPRLATERPKPGENIVLVAADVSPSLDIRDKSGGDSRRAQVAAAVGGDDINRLEQDFEVRKYLFADQVKQVQDFGDLQASATSTSLLSSLRALGTRYKDQPVAGLLVFTDGNLTDQSLLEETDFFDWSLLPPVFPVIVGQSIARDIAISQVSVTESNFETKPITVQVEFAVRGFSAEPLITRLVDAEGTAVEEAKLTTQNKDEQRVVHRFEFRPQKRGPQFYRIQVFAERDKERWEEKQEVREATSENNTQLVMVNRRTGPYRVLYVSGRPNWEFKFLRRALDEDDEVELVGLVRIAKKEPKFVFRSRSGERTNPLYRGFKDGDSEDVEQYDQPVFVRLGTKDEAELRDGFPATADVLYQYHAIVLDDVEAAFFSRDQMSLVEDFVRRRGGGLMMLGGQECFSEGKYAHTPLADLLPVHVNQQLAQGMNADETFRWQLTREGWLEPWNRLRETRQSEQQRLAEMPPFRVLNKVRSVKPGAMTVAEAVDSQGKRWPALVTQKFGEGRSVALLLGDVWRWHLKRDKHDNTDVEQTWRQSLQWLLKDVPRPVEVGVKPDPVKTQLHHIRVQVRDKNYEPLENALVTVVVTTPAGEAIQLQADADFEQTGTYDTAFLAEQAGAYRVTVEAVSVEQESMGTAASGWAFTPRVNEFRSIDPDPTFLERVAAKTKGAVYSLKDLPQIVRDLPTRDVPIKEPWDYPLWQHPGVLCLILSLLAGEWFLRRWKGLA